MRKRLLIAVLALVLFGVGTIAWTLAGLPPPMHYIRYGLDPACEPTGETLTVEGVTFVEIGPGIFPIRHLKSSSLLFGSSFAVPAGGSVHSRFRARLLDGLRSWFGSVSPSRIQAGSKTA